MRANSRNTVTKEQKRALKAKGDLLHSLAARALARREFPEDDVRSLRRILKQIGRVESVVAAAELDAEADKRLDKLRAVLGVSADDHEQQSDCFVAPAAGKRSTVRSAQDTDVGAQQQKLDALIELEELKRREMRVVRAIIGGATASDALRAENFEATSARIRRALRQRKQFECHGTLDDLRHGRSGRESDVMTTDMKTTISVLWLRHRYATAPGILKALRVHIEKTEKDLVSGHETELRERGVLLVDQIRDGSIKLPSVESVRAFLRAKSKSERTLREQGPAEYQRQGRPLGNLPDTRYANELWELDHSRLDIYVRVERDGQWRQEEVWLTILLDVHSRAIVNAILSSRTPDSFTTAMLLRGAILPIDDSNRLRPFGVPDLIRTDRGSDFMAVQTQQFCRKVGIDLDFCKPRRPDEKPHVERFFGTLQGNLLPLLPGYKHGNTRSEPWTSRRISNLLTVKDLRIEFDRWVREYNGTTHSAIDMRPLEMWRTSVSHRALPDRETLNMMLLHRTTRMVRNTTVGLSLISGAHQYWGEILTAMNGQTIVVRYNPDDDEVIYAYDPGDEEFLGELRRKDLVGQDRMNEAWYAFKREKRQQDKNLDSRVQQYHVAAHENDRLSKAALREKRDKLAAERLATEFEARSSSGSDAGLGDLNRSGTMGKGDSGTAESPDITSTEQKLDDFLRKLSA